MPNQGGLANQNPEFHTTAKVRMGDKGKAIIAAENNKKITMASVFKDPRILFPKIVGQSTAMNNGNNGIEDVDMIEDITIDTDKIVGGKKQSRTGKATEDPHSEMHVRIEDREEESSQSKFEEIVFTCRP